MNIEFVWPWAFAVLPLPLLVRWLMPRAEENTGAALRLPFYKALTERSVVRQSAPSRIRLWLAVMVWALLVTAAARPQYLGEAVHLPVSGRDLLLAVDISGSMETEDMISGVRVTSRLVAVKRVASEFIERRKGDRIGLILFGEQAYLQTPLTFDRKTVTTQLLEAAIGLAGKRTAIGDAIGLAIKRLREQPEGNRVLILLTDGANTAGSIAPLKAADIAAQQGVKIYTIGVGADEMVVQGLFGRQRVANTELDEATLEAIADKTGGRYFRARDTRGLEEVYRLLDKLEPASQEDEVFRPRHELYVWPLAAALLLSLLMVTGQLRLLQRLRQIGVQHA